MLPGLKAALAPPLLKFFLDTDASFPHNGENKVSSNRYGVGNGSLAWRL